MQPPNTYTRTWFETFLDGFPADMTDREIHGLIQWIPLPRFRTILDVCCGAGRHAAPLTALGYAVTGVDRDAIALAEAQERVPDGRFILLDQRDIQHIGETFDAVVILWQSFGYFDRKGNDDVLRQLATLIRTGGRLALDLYHPAYFARHQERRKDPRLGVAAITDTLAGTRLNSTIEYSDGTIEKMDFELFTPDDLVRHAARFGFSVVGTCCWWDPSRPPDPNVARYQIILQRHNGDPTTP